MAILDTARSRLSGIAMMCYLVFGDVPNRWTMAGAAVVIASGLYLLHRERVRSREDAKLQGMRRKT